MLWVAVVITVGCLTNVLSFLRFATERDFAQTNDDGMDAGVLAPESEARSIVPPLWIGDDLDCF